MLQDDGSNCALVTDTECARIFAWCCHGPLVLFPYVARRFTVRPKGRRSCLAILGIIPNDLAVAGACILSISVCAPAVLGAQGLEYTLPRSYHTDSQSGAHTVFASQARGARRKQ
jgi:hypothetical protein